MYYFLSFHDDQNGNISWSIAIIRSVKDTYEYVMKTVHDFEKLETSKTARYHKLRICVKRRLF